MKKISAVIVDKNPTTNEVLKQYIEDNKKITKITQFLDLKKAYDFICQEKPKLILIDMEYGEDAVFNLTNKIYENDNECKIVISGSRCSGATIIKARKVGAKDIIKKPFIKKDLEAVITKMVNQINFEDETKKLKVVTVFSTKGGIGKTTIATNLAAEIANITKERTVIVDFNSRFGDVSTFVNTESNYGINYFIEHKEHLNKDFLLANLPRYKKTNLYIMADLFFLDENTGIDLEDVQDIIDALKATFSYIVVDMNPNISLNSTKIFDNSDDILVPIVANMPNLRNCQRTLSFLKKMGYEDENIKLILNRYMKKDEIKADSVKRTLQKEVYAKISNDYYSVINAINRGIIVSEADNNTAFSKDIQNLAYMLVKDEE